jgi:ferritin-like metal-binding protein YciE
MTLIATAASLLHAAVQDLHAGKTDAAKRLPGVADHATDAALVTLLQDEAQRAGKQADRLAATGMNAAGPKNLWMAGILDDAERDGSSTEPGRLLDIALIGAIRKAKAAEIVSSETALALATELDDAALSAAVRANLEEEIATDRALKARLAALTIAARAGA